jgi:AcrR family transcriptional regulator
MPNGNSKQEQIMQAAERLFTTGRVHEITLDQVAEAAGVGKGTIYRYFADKDDLFFQTATAGFDELCELLRHEVTEGVSFREQLLLACGRTEVFFAGRRQLIQMMAAEEGRAYWFSPALRQRWMARRGNLVAALGQIIQRGVVEGVVRPDVDPQVFAVLLLGMLRAAARDMPEGLSGRASHGLIVQVFCGGVGTPISSVEART